MPHTMPSTSSPAPVIVTRREIERLLLHERAESAIHESARQRSELEQAQAMAMTGAILRELQKSENNQGTDRVLVAAQHGPTSRLQSLIASGEAGQLSLEPMPAGGLEAKFDTQDWPGWATVAWAKLKNPKPHPLIRPPQSSPRPLPSHGRIGLLGDWGTGLYGAPKIAETIRKDRDPFAMLMHLGDVYYAGAANEIRERFLSLWPMRPEAIHRALNGNHEMYSGGKFYFESILPTFHQDASYFFHQNADWTLVGLDVAHTDHAIDDEQVRWLEGVLEKAGDRKVVLFSHHQLFSSYEVQGVKLWENRRFASVLKSKRVFAWYWGHEHRCSIYEERDTASGLWGRCVGHGGMPESRKKTLGLPQAIGYSKADWRQVPAKVDGLGVCVAPPSLVLEGPNPYISGEEEEFTPHGYAILTLDGSHLIEQVLDPDGSVIYEHQLA